MGRVGIRFSNLESYSSSWNKPNLKSWNKTFKPILRRALLNNECGGGWQLPPSDAPVRRYLIAEGLLQKLMSQKMMSQARVLQKMMSFRCSRSIREDLSFPTSRHI